MLVSTIFFHLVLFQPIFIEAIPNPLSCKSIIINLREKRWLGVPSAILIN